MRVVFMGTPAFAVPSLRALAESHEVVAVYTRPDSVSGRGGATRPSAVRQAALELGLELYTPRTLKDPSEHGALAELAPDAGVVAAYGFILPREILSVPLHGFLNVHASLLPRWRGAAPIQRAILSGDEVTGVSIMRMEEGLDTGPFCDVAETLVDDKSAETLTEELSRLGTQALLRTLDRIADGTCVWTPQDETRVTYADKIAKEDVRLKPDLPAAQLVRRVRASSKQAPARLAVGDSVLTVTDAHESDVSVPAGIARRHGQSLLLGTTAGSLELETVKPEGRKDMDAPSWLRGTSISGDVPWTSAP